MVLHAVLLSSVIGCCTGQRKSKNSEGLKTSRKTGPLPSQAHGIRMQCMRFFSPCRCFFLFVLGWRIGFAVRRNNTLFDVKICVCRHLPGAKNHAHPHSFCPRTAWYWCVFPARR